MCSSSRSYLHPAHLQGRLKEFVVSAKTVQELHTKAKEVTMISFMIDDVTTKFGLLHFDLRLCFQSAKLMKLRPPLRRLWPCLMTLAMFGQRMKLVNLSRPLPMSRRTTSNSSKAGKTHKSQKDKGKSMMFHERTLSNPLTYMNNKLKKSSSKYSL
ncbi:hypothetical protein L6452_37415 [Arctium lappa]|uniref:Uncharacterized protein n=1 Tax=Arctium lappa TaxID=4217 RepID=A0ACB8Y726_ARCLA|nr:hypothetical protein L6452_37415 [Arctium lappa]